jgi:hypothetical protein
MIQLKNDIGRVENIFENFTLPQFVKHIGFADMSYNPNYKNYLKGLGMLLAYGDFIELNGINLIGFKSPITSDPTEKAQFSNLLGKAIADFLSKKISNCVLSYNYEGAMQFNGHPISGGRPDLYCLSTNKRQFAIECKGFSKKSVSNNEMSKHKRQSKSGPLHVHFSIASVTYNIYKNISVKYFDPINPNIRYNEKLNNRIINSVVT